MRHHPSIHLSIHQSIHLSIHPFIHPSIHPFIHPFIHPSIHLSIRLSIHPSTRVPCAGGAETPKQVFPMHEYEPRTLRSTVEHPNHYNISTGVEEIERETRDSRSLSSGLCRGQSGG